MCAESHLELFKPDEIVYLSPDSDKVLQSVDADKVYILGGLVDEHIQKVSITMLCLSLELDLFRPLCNVLRFSMLLLTTGCHTFTRRISADILCSTSYQGIPHQIPTRNLQKSSCHQPRSSICLFLLIFSLDRSC